MIERPILFSSTMIKAILDGQKTQTRRVIKLQRPEWRFVDLKTDLGYKASIGNLWAGFLLGPDSQSPGYFKCPYGKPGDLLWVRETFRIFNSFDGCSCYDICTCSRHNGKIIYFADNFDTESKWKPSIHMPRWASRITLEIKAVRVERLQEITEEDAIKEGIKPQACFICGYTYFDCLIQLDHNLCGNGTPEKATDDFAKLWDSINGKTYPWASNPWVWVIEFERVKP